jgi:hypothetical protein
VGGGSDLRADLVGDGVHRVRLRRVLATDRRLALRVQHAHRTPARRPRNGAVDPRNSRPHPSRAAGRVDPSQRRRQYCAIRYGNRLAEAGAVASIGSVGDSFDNALAESVIGLYKTECVRRDGPARSAEDLELATASWVHWFNIHRLHSMIGNVPPVKYEQNYYASQPDREAPISGEPSLHWSRFPPPRHR